METSNKLFNAAKTPAIITTLLLLVPLSAELLMDEMGWGPGDFIAAGILLFGTGFCYKLITIHAEKFIYRAAVALALGSGFFLIWSNLAVGIIGSEDNVANLIYFGVALVPILGAIITRFRPKGMAYALFSTAFAQSLTIVVALVAGMQHYPPHSSAYEIILFNGLFITLFSVSGGLFWLAAEEHNGVGAEASA